MATRNIGDFRARQSIAIGGGGSSQMKARQLVSYLLSFPLDIFFFLNG